MTSMTQAQMAEHDARQFELYQDAARAEGRLGSLRAQMHSTAGDKPRWYGRSKAWGMSHAEVTAKIQDMAAAGDAYDPGRGLRPSEAIARQAALDAEIAGLRVRIGEMESTWREHRWTRWFPCLNADGHIHSSLRGCSTVQASTAMGWETELSGLPVADAIAKLGPRLCSVCFPEAPAEHCRSLSDITRAEREAKKAEREAAKYVKALRDSEQFRDHGNGWVTTVAGCKTALRDEVEFRDYYGRGEHPFHAGSVRAASDATRVLLARGVTQEEISKIIENAVKANRKAGARI